MTAVYRLVRAARRENALSGEGARLYGGRWNPPGRPVVYASESRALAVLETFVHLTLEARAMRFLLCEIELPARARRQRQREPCTPRESREAGRAWLDAGRTLVLAVPSVIVPEEANVVLNVRHPQFAQLRMAPPQPFSFDERLWKGA